MIYIHAAQLLHRISLNSFHCYLPIYPYVLLPLYISICIVTLLYIHMNFDFDSNKSTNKVQQFHKFITWCLCVAQHVWAPQRPSSGAYNCTRSLWFYRWKEAAGALLVVVWPTGSCTLLMMGGWTPETCWAIYERRVINLRKCCILLVDLFECRSIYYINDTVVIYIVVMLCICWL